MSACYLHVCPACGFEVEAWDDGHPYIVDDAGRRHFFYHPAERDVIDPIVAKSAWAKGLTYDELQTEVPRHLGNMAETICGDCGAEDRTDRGPNGFVCGKCGSHQVWDLMELAGKPCPKCKTGRFSDEPQLGGIS